MATTIDQVETVDRDPIWSRIEAYIAWRFTERAVGWVVEGGGEWVPPLRPATVTQVQKWAGGDGWQTVTVPPSPRGGLMLDDFGPWRITATVGQAPVPQVVQEAYDRLQAYLAEDPGSAKGFTGFEDQVGDVSTKLEGAANWASKALQRSGAADLLRPYRRA